MKMKCYLNVTTMAVLTAFLFVPILGAQSGNMDRSGSPMKMHGMTAQSKAHCQKIGVSIDSVLESIHLAEQSNVPEQMKAELERLKGNLAGMKSDMNRCMNMGNMQDSHMKA